jgi:cycloeucalenol cycloisomerase
LALGWAGRAAVVLVLAYAIAFAETLFMANDLMTDLFSYDKREKMLSIGSFGYATYFVVGLPLAARIDEPEPTSVGRVALEALAACMLILVLLEAWVRIIGRL